MSEIIRHIEAGSVCCDARWEAAYRRFQSPEQEVRMFVRRLTWFGFPALPRDLRIVDVFCGRGGGLEALGRLGFEHLEGVDLSEELLRQYSGPARLHLADCRRLPLANRSCDVVVVQGGLHHLPQLPADLEQVVSEVQRVLREGGRFYVVEPWLTPFLRFVHLVVSLPVIRKAWVRGDALAEMIDRERETYEQWLSMPDQILRTLGKHFETQRQSIRLGKCRWIGTPRIAH